MSTTAIATSSSPEKYGRAFWERLWRTAGIQAIGLLLIAGLLYGRQPGVGAPAAALAAFYGGNHLRILVATPLLGLGVLNLLWFAAALRASLANAGQDGWGAAATASSSIVGGMFLFLAAVVASIAHSASGGNNSTAASALNDLVWAAFVLASFPRAMLIMAGSLGFWRAGLISDKVFAAGVGCIVLTLLGGTTWFHEGFWAPDGAYSLWISPIVGLLWVLVASRVLIRAPAARSGW